MNKRTWKGLLTGVGLVGGVVMAGIGGCGELRALNESCDSATDCPSPWVCCNEPRLPTGDPVPYCEERDGCNDWLPVMAEGNPCNRTRSGHADDSCRAGLECCATSLTCAKPGQCPAEDPDPPAAGSGLPCGSDLDCGDGELCCNINFSVRDGLCSTLAECTSGMLPVPAETPSADAGL